MNNFGKFSLWRKLILLYFFNGRAIIVRTNQRGKVLVKLFLKKLAGSRVGTLVALRRGRNFPYPSQNAGEGEFLCRAKEEGEPSSAMSLS